MPKFAKKTQNNILLFKDKKIKTKMVICNFCNKILTNSAILKTHQKTAKYCLEIQGLPITFKCDFCNKNYSQKRDLTRHHLTCVEKKISEKDQIISEKDKIIFEKDKNLVAKDKILEEKLSEKDKIFEEKLAEKDARIKELQDHLVDIIKTRPPTTVNNNNQRINTIINNLQPITDEHLLEQSKYLTIDHIKEGVDGYVKYALEYPFKDRIVCVDYSRKKIKYKDQDNNIIEDPEMLKLSRKFFQAIEGKNTEIIENQLQILHEQLEELNNDSNNEMDEDETLIFQNNSERLTNKIFSYRDNRIDIMDASKGQKSEICSGFIKNICAKVLKH